MIALGVQESYVDYMMGHIPDTYHDIQSLGIEKLRSIYAAAGLAIRPKTQHSKLETIKEMMWGIIFILWLTGFSRQTSMLGQGQILLIIVILLICLWIGTDLNKRQMKKPEPTD